MKTKPTLRALALILSIVTLCVIHLLPSRSDAQAVQSPLLTSTEHYKVVGVADDDPAALESKLNKLAAQGWRLRVSFTGDQFRGLILAR